MLAQVIADITTKDRAELFLKDFLTETEHVAMAKRLAIMIALEKQQSYEDIKDRIKVSSATIAHIQSQLEKKTDGLMLVLRLIKAEEWATKWTGKITGLFGKK